MTSIGADSRFEKRVRSPQVYIEHSLEGLGHMVQNPSSPTLRCPSPHQIVGIAPIPKSTECSPSKTLSNLHCHRSGKSYYTQISISSFLLSFQLYFLSHFICFSQASPQKPLWLLIFPSFNDTPVNKSKANKCSIIPLPFFPQP